MRILLVLLVLSSAFASKGQTAFPMSFTDYNQLRFLGSNHFTDSVQNKKWFFTRYTGISTSYSFFKGGSATTFAVPLSLQLNRKLNNNLYAFAAVSAAPAYINFNRSFLSSNTVKNWQSNGVQNANSFGMYSKAELGLMYINDAKTFSISGSIGIERSSFPVMPYNQANTVRSNPAIYR